MGELCLPAIFGAFDEVKNKASVSHSVVVYGALNDDLFPDSPTRNVVLKLALPSEPSDNSLEVERKMYGLVHELLKSETPHLLEGLYEGTCTDESILDMKFSEKRSERTLYEQWAGLRLERIYSSFTLAQRQRWTEELAQSNTAWSFQNVAFLANMAFPMSTVSFVVTPKMAGMSLAAFLEKRGADLTAEEFIEIAVQIAQCLAVLEKHRISHHDLHFGNIWIRELPEGPELVVYSYPKPPPGQENYSVLSRFRVTIFDFDRASGDGLYNTRLAPDGEFCSFYGSCNDFVHNYDWYTVLSWFREMQTDESIPVPATILSLLRDNDAATDRWLGHPCSCPRANGANPVEASSPAPLRQNQSFSAGTAGRSLSSSIQIRGASVNSPSSFRSGGAGRANASRQSQKTSPGSFKPPLDSAAAQDQGSIMLNASFDEARAQHAWADSIPVAEECKTCTLRRAFLDKLMSAEDFVRQFAHRNNGEFAEQSPEEANEEVPRSFDSQQQEEAPPSDAEEREQAPMNASSRSMHGLADHSRSGSRSRRRGRRFSKSRRSSHHRR